ncbi:MAG: EF-hand domain-containing protein [Gammaproteobacteria bacterium]|jgi:hypothetical protein|nr:EF-hand domain-containing protein [Gammaproteobacteria bacterium]
MSSVNAPRLSMEALRYLKRNQGPEAARLADDLFTRLDTRRQGYLQAGDLEQALAASGPKAERGGASAATALFDSLDHDGDGRLTREEFSWSVSRLADRLLQRLKVLHAPRDAGVAAPDGAAVAGEVLNAEWRTLEEDAGVTSTSEADVARDAPLFGAGGTFADGGADAALMNQIARLALAYGVNDGRDSLGSAPRFAARV